MSVRGVIKGPEHVVYNALSMFARKAKRVAKTEIGMPKGERGS